MNRIIFLFSSFLLFSLVYADESVSIAKRFYSTDNSIEKRSALKSLKGVAIPEGQTSPKWISDLLGNALNDESPSVVAEASRQIGHFTVVEHSNSLVNLFKDSHARFGSSGYTQKVQYAVVTALGKLGTNKAKELVVSELQKDEGSVMGEYLLLAIQEFGDLSLINEVKVYRSKMDEYIKDAKAKELDPILYSRNITYSNLTRTIEEELSKGGK